MILLFQVLDNLFLYLNKQHIKRQRYSDADLTYGGLTMDQIRNSMMEIGEVRDRAAQVVESQTGLAKDVCSNPSRLSTPIRCPVELRPQL